jgi:hypothetical protein
MLEISLLPTLRVQRELYDLPPGPARFRRYLDLMRGNSNDLVLPLPVFNPMGKKHVSEMLDTLLELDAEGVAKLAIEEAHQRLADVDARFEVALVLADDKGGGWTNRYYTEIENRFRPGSLLKRGWAVALAWTSEIPTSQSIRRAVLATIYRNVFVLKHGEPRSLRDMMEQEGLAGVFSGETGSDLDADEIEYTREVIRPYLDAADLTVILPALFGDQAARSVGNDPLGLSERAGLALALSDASKTMVY